MAELISTKIIVSGKVQGVWFRAFTREFALKLGIEGNVRNKDDGTVQIVARAKPRDLDEFIEGLKKGPTHAVVDRLDIDIVKLDSSLKGFKIIR